MQIGMGIGLPLKNTSSEIEQAVAYLRSLGEDAHVWLPGVGTLNGLTAGNYLLSDGSTGLAPVDGYVGRVNDAMGVLGAELNADTTAGWTPYTATQAVTSETITVTSSGANGGVYKNFTTVVGKTYFVSVIASNGTSNSATLKAGGVVISATTTGQKYISGYYVAVGTSTPVNLELGTTGVGNFGAISVREISGIHATQATTANKPQLKLSGGSYSWLFDGSNDSLALSAPVFQMSDDHCVAVGATCAALASSRVLFSQRNTGNTMPVVGQVYAGADGSLNAFYRNAENTSSANFGIAGGSVVVGVPFVVSVSKVSNTASIRKDEGSAATSVTPTTGTFTINAAAIGASAENGSDAFYGGIHAVIVVKATVPEDKRKLLVKLAANLSGVTL